MNSVIRNMLRRAKRAYQSIRISRQQIAHSSADFNRFGIECVVTAPRRILDAALSPRSVSGSAADAARLRLPLDALRARTALVLHVKLNCAR